jgi:hypothetical protein
MTMLGPSIVAMVALASVALAAVAAQPGVSRPGLDEQTDMGAILLVSSDGAALPQTDRASLPSVTHRVARDRINARAGPGTTHRIVRKLSRGTLLALIEKRGDWGHFALSNGGTPAPRIWAALRLLEPVGGRRDAATTGRQQDIAAHHPCAAPGPVCAPAQQRGAAAMLAGRAGGA